MDTTQNNKVDTFKIPENWEARSKQLKEKFHRLTERDLTLEAGEEEELITRIETRLNKKRDEVISLISKSQAELV